MGFFLAKTVVFADFGLKVVKLTNSFHSRVRTQGGNINFVPENCSFKTAVFFTENRSFRKTTCLEKVTPIFSKLGVY